MTSPEPEAPPEVHAATGVAVAPHDAFRVFTEEIGMWWQQGKELGTGRAPRRARLRFEPGVGGRLLEVYDDGARPFEVGRVRVWDPPHRLVFEWRQGNFTPDETSEVEVRFEATPEGTRVIVEHRGLEALPADHGARHGLEGEAFVRMFSTFWDGILDEFAAHAEASGVSRD